MTFFLVACLLPSFVISCLVTALLRKIAPALGLIDQPGHRKVHQKPTALGGGIGIWFGVMIPLVVLQGLLWKLESSETVPSWIPDVLAPHLTGASHRTAQLWIVIGAATLIALVGLIDDLKNLSWKFRLGIQVVVALLLVFPGKVQATVFLSVPIIGILLSLFWILVLINSLNFLDNMDGLTGGIAVVVCFIFTIVMLYATREPRWFIAGMLLLLGGSVLGFLVHNWSPARIFMGDSGSYFIGCLLASLTVLGTFYDESVSGRHVMLAPIFALAVPLYDFCSVMYLRLSEGRSPFEGDKRHFSHRLVNLGLKPVHAVLTVHLATLMTGLGALLLYAVESWRGAAIVISLILCTLLMIAILESTGAQQNEQNR